MDTIHPSTSVRDRVLAVLKGEQPDRLPFIGRLELWRRGLLHTGGLPEEFADLSLTGLHRAVGMGQQRFLAACSLRLRGVEAVSRFQDEVVQRARDPVCDRFPDVDEWAPADRPGVTTHEFITPVGRLVVQHTQLDSLIASGARPYVTRHPIQTEEDERVVAYILERAEVVPRFERLQAAGEEIGDIGFVVPSLNRIPFQQLLIDYFSTEMFFEALHSRPRSVARLQALLDAQVGETVARAAELDAPYVEFVDNLDGMMTSPRLFRQHCLPAYQRYLEVLHGQGKKVGSHTDGELRPLLDLLRESGLDVCESVSPAPLTSCPFEEIWERWREGPLIWGGIPSPLLEARTSEETFGGFLDRLLAILDGRPIILCPVDMVLPNNSIARIRRIAERVEGFTP